MKSALFCSLSVGALALLPCGAAAMQVEPPLEANVTPPPLWYGGDVHELIQLCADPTGMRPPDRTPDEIYAEMRAKNLNVADVLVLVTGSLSCAQYLATYAPLVTGREHSCTRWDPDFVLQFGTEVVGGADSGCEYPAWGHVVGLGIRNAAYRLGADYPAPNLDFFRAQPDGVAGYAHVSWPEGTDVPGSFPPISRDLTRLHPLLAPTDVALGRVDFLSTPDVGHVATEITDHPWWGLYYKLLNAGLRVSMAGGSVAQCYLALGPLDARTYARLDSLPLTHDKWTAAVVAGRVTLADGPSDFLMLTVDGREMGEELRLEGPGPVLVEATLTTAVPRRTRIELVQDGVVVATDPVRLNSPGTHTFRIPLDVRRSGWLAARTTKTHTGAVFTLVDDEPIADPDAAGYFLAFGEHLLDYLDAANALCERCPTRACAPCRELEAWVGTSEEPIRDEIAEANALFRALRDFRRPLPPGTLRYGAPKGSCRGPMAIGLAGPPVAGRDVTFTCINAPPESLGVLAVSPRPQSPALHYLGIPIHVGVSPLPQFHPATSHGGGYAEVTVPIPPSATEMEVFAQFLWANNPRTCPGNEPWNASDGLRVAVRPNLSFTQ